MKVYIDKSANGNRCLIMTGFPDKSIMRVDNREVAMVNGKAFINFEHTDTEFIKGKKITCNGYELIIE
jgi:hypothetical protein